MLNKTIKAIESKGYIVKSSENKWLGKVNESCPVAYEILKPDYTVVYGANGISPDELIKWLTLPDLVNSESKPAVIHDAAVELDCKANEKSWDNTYNEGKEGYNPYR